MRTALVCEKWELPLIDAKGGFLDHTNVSELSRRALCMEWLLAGIPEGKKVTEYFGGIGLQSVIIKELLKPSAYSIFDLSQECVDQLRLAIGETPQLLIDVADAKESMKFNEAEIAFLDFPDMTCMHYEEWNDSLKALFATEPKLVEITDIGNRYLHLHKKRYGEILGTTIVNYEDYIRGISNYLHTRYGYSVVRSAYKSGAAYMLLGPVAPEWIEFKYFGPDKNGFRYIDDGN